MTFKRSKIKSNMEKSSFPWVFWFSVSIRRKWFKRWWKTRGANFLEIQAWIFKISIGMPWLNEPVYRFRKDYGSHNHIRETNEANLKQPFSFQIGRRKRPNQNI